MRVPWKALHVVSGTIRPEVIEEQEGIVLLRRTEPDRAA